jgi:hypothetical protein
VPIIGDDQKLLFTWKIDWPFKLTILGKVYTHILWILG